jgi:hypothetical protein
MVNITRLSSDLVVVSFEVLNAASAEVYQDNISIKAITTPANYTYYSATVAITHTTLFTLIATNSTGKTVRSQLTVQVDTVPIGTIAMWNGLYNDIPAGWKICDGTGGAPNLKEKFIVGCSDDTYHSSSSHYLGQTGGGGGHSHPVTTTSRSFTTNKDGQHSHEMRFDKTKDVDNGSNNSNSYYHGDGDQFTDNDSTNSLHSHSFTIPSLSGTAATAYAEAPPFYALYYIMKYQ